MVGELVTHAHQYASGPVLMQLRTSGGGADVVVRDGNPAVPVIHAADPGRAGQCGLETIKEVAEKPSIEREPIGKRMRRSRPPARLGVPHEPGLRGPVEGSVREIRCRLPETASVRRHSL
ncbi:MULTISPECIES: hypothetical protein [unclassified Streptomyces]|uniref:hypothetical protein n=1 Tax=unclassified Streptomyces TaxID=2593676 RepID=UPI00382E3404